MSATKTQTREEWLKSLSIGDDVAICSWGTTPRIEKVCKVTATQIVLSRDIRYRIANGSMVGKSYNSTNLQEPTQAILDTIEKASLGYKVACIKPRALTIDQLRRIAAIVAETAKGEDE